MLHTRTCDSERLRECAYLHARVKVRARTGARTVEREVTRELGAAE